MHLTISIKKELANHINKFSKRLNKSRSFIITQALEDWIQKHQKDGSWPENFFDFEPVDDVPDFKALSRELK
jgi:metal-responsive CopG/Arc/MetJ family transcriptional regulator